MIDYKKLKLAHELVSKLPFDDFDLELQVGTYNNIVLHYTDNESMFHEYEYDCIDDVIATLQELTQPKPKYEVGTTWWYLDEANFVRFAKPRSLLITEENKNWYRADEEWYPTKSQLIEAQIEYWQSLIEIKPGQKGETGPISYYPAFEGPIKSFADSRVATHAGYNDENAQQCRHQSNGLSYMTNPPQNKCLKCGEFYR